MYIMQYEIYSPYQLDISTVQSILPHDNYAPLNDPKNKSLPKNPKLISDHCVSTLVQCVVAHLQD